VKEGTQRAEHEWRNGVMMGERGGIRWKRSKRCRRGEKFRDSI